MAVFARPFADANSVAILQHEMMIGRRDVDVSSANLLPVGRMARGQTPGAREHSWQQAWRFRRCVDYDQDGSGKIRRRRLGNLQQRFDRSRRSADQDDVARCALGFFAHPSRWERRPFRWAPRPFACTLAKERSEEHTSELQSPYV